MLFATLILDRDPLQWSELLPAIVNWFASVGAIAAIGLFLVFALRASFSFDRLFSWEGDDGRLRAFMRFGVVGAAVHAATSQPQAPQVRPRRSEASRLLAIAGTYAVVASWVGYLAVAGIFIAALSGVKRAERWLPGLSPLGLTVGDLLCAASGVLAIAVVLYPVLRAVFVDMRIGRVWAVAKLSIKESIRNGSVAVFGVIALIFLFADWFIPYKPEDQVRNYVWVLYWSMMVLFLLTAGIYGSFSIPLDIKNQTIHTVVTKPITKFEVVLGRFFGYGLLLTIGLFAVGLLSMGYVMRGVTEEAKSESLLARVPIYGDVHFLNTNKPGGDSVGREWDYRRYISGQNMTPGKKQYAYWWMSDLSEIQPRANNKVRIEYAFDIFRLTKGDENKDINCSFKFAPGDWEIDKIEAKLLERQRKFDEMNAEARKQAQPGADFAAINAKIEAKLLEDYPVFQLSGVPVTDYHTLPLDIPYSLIERLRVIDKSATVGKDGQRPPAMQIFVCIDPDRASSAQMLGVASRDLYVLAAEKNFYVNFFKGLVGLWFCTLLVLGIAICCSTYLSGVISLLCTMFLLLAGFFMPSIMQMATNQSPGGGPAEALSRIVNRSNLVTPLEESTTTTVIQGIDATFRWTMRRILTVIPDASRYDLHTYVANGFDISPTKILFLDGFLPLVAYLLPWFVLAFYLINFREIANPT